MSILDQICADKKDHVDQKRAEKNITDLKNIVLDQENTREFKSKILNFSDDAFPALIAEIKKASPSSGIIRKDFDVKTIAKSYESGGACCLSVLTDTPYFQGEDQFIKIARQACALPVLRKDFIIDDYQVYESRALGADCILLIMAALEPDQAEDYLAISRELGMDTLVEVHNHDELGHALNIKADMIGINNRNLKTMEITLETSMDMVEYLPENCLKIAESGINTYEDICKLRRCGFQGFLVGESLMRQENLEQAVTGLLYGNLTQNKN